MKTLRSSVIALIIFLFPLILSACATPPWHRQASTDIATGAEVLFVGAGNTYGLLGHAALRLDGLVYGFWLIDCSLVLESMDEDDFFKLYLQYELRNVEGFEIELTDAQIDKLREEIAFGLGVPYPDRPKYNMISNNCATGIYYLFDELRAEKSEEMPQGIWTMGKLKKWIQNNFTVKKERFYANYRHAAMRERLSQGSDITRDFIVPFTRCDSHLYRYWRLVYTEDLMGKAALLRPVAGVGNMTAGAVQTVSGVLRTPFGKMQDVFRGIGSMVAAVPELVFIPIRRAGRPSPMRIDKVERILREWQPNKELRHNRELPATGSRSMRNRCKPRPVLNQRTDFEFVIPQ